MKQIQFYLVLNSAQRVDDELKPAPLEEKGNENDEIYKTPILIIPGIEQQKTLQYLIYNTKDKICILDKYQCDQFWLSDNGFVFPKLVSQLRF